MSVYKKSIYSKYFQFHIWQNIYHTLFHFLRNKLLELLVKFCILRFSGYSEMLLVNFIRSYILGVSEREDQERQMSRHKNLWLHKLWVDGLIIGYVRVYVDPLGLPQGTIKVHFGLKKKNFLINYIGIL